MSADLNAKAAQLAALDEGQRRAARLVVCAHARDVADAAQLLDALGLGPHPRRTRTARRPTDDPQPPRPGRPGCSAPRCAVPGSSCVARRVGRGRAAGVAMDPA